MNRDMIVYLIATEDMKFCKIGVSANVKRRLREIQVNHPGNLVLLAEKYGSYDAEKKLHTDLKFWKTRGEWFFFSKEVLHAYSETGCPPWFFVKTSEIQFAELYSRIMPYETMTKKLQDRVYKIVSKKTGVPIKEINMIASGGCPQFFKTAKALSDYFYNEAP